MIRRMTRTRLGHYYLCLCLPLEKSDNQAFTDGRHNIDSLAGRHVGVERRSGEAGANREHQIGSHEILLKGLGAETADAPKERGWVSGKALLPGFVVSTGASNSSATATSSSVASAHIMPAPAKITGGQLPPAVSPPLPNPMDRGPHEPRAATYSRARLRISPSQTSGGTSISTGPDLPLRMRW